MGASCDGGKVFEAPMNPRDYDPDITAIVDAIRAAGGTVTAIFIERADGKTLGNRPLPLPEPCVSGLCDVATALKKFGPGRKDL